MGGLSRTVTADEIQEIIEKSTSKTRLRPLWPTTPTCHLLRESQKMRQEWRRWTNFFQELKFSPVLHFVLYLFSFLADNLSPKLILLQVSKQIKKKKKKKKKKKS